MKLLSTIYVLLFLILSHTASAQSGISFTTSTLAGVNLSNPTTLAFGPDNRLYVTQQDGNIFAYTIQKNGPNNYVVTNTELISLVRNIPNHYDNGELFTAYVQRQVTGIVATGTAANPVLYICSSDPRIGGGGELGDINLDTNSGMISKLTKTGSTWQMTHLVRGLPRCEENHSPNGLVLDEVNNILYVAQGGNTNAGSPSNNFGFLGEYALSAAILSIDIDMINQQFGGSYTLPTLDDPTRPNNPDGSDVNDPFGGNDGLNQAKLVIGGPVQIYAPGFRLSYDLLITKTPGRAGRMYTIGNGGNAGWGGYPENEGTPNVTNNRLFSEPGSTEPTMTDDKVNNRDGLHYVSSPGYYAGHPNPIRANPAGAGWYWFDNNTGIGHFEQNPTVDWPPYPVELANPIESDYRNPGVNDGSLYTWGHSTNGMAEYTSTAFFNGAMAGNLLAACWDGGIYRIELSQDGTVATQVTKMFTGFGDTPLDVIAQGDGEIYAGSIWAIVYGGNGVTIFEPVGSPVTCSGDNDNYNLDDDGDGYSNGDETDNGTDPCSASSKPNDYDQDLISDLADNDDDNDGINDINDRFALDANNGMGTQVPLDYPFLNGNPGFGFFGIGQTGLMTNYVDNYAEHFDLDDPALIAGGAVGVLSVPAQTGDATTNNQKYAFQFGVPIGQAVSSFTLNSRLLGSPFFNGATGSNLGTQSVGMYFGNGDQDNYFKFVLHANNGNPGFQILCEQGGVVVNQQMIPISNILSNAQVELFIDVNPVTGAVVCRYQTLSMPTPVSVGESFTVSGTLLNLLVNDTDAVAVGVIASCGNKVPFSASWDYMKVTKTEQPLTNVIRINSGGPAQNFGGQAWVADQYFTGGNTYSTAAAIAGTTQDQVYQTERYGNFTYAIPVTGAGTYAVDLHFAEIYFTTAGSRIFNVNIENGQFVRNNLDLIQTAGSINTAYVLRADNLNITDGVINITFTTVADNAKISGIAVSRYGTPPVGNTPPVVVQAYPDQSVPSTQSSLVVPLGQIFNDDGGVNNLTFTVANNTNAALISNTQIAASQLTLTLSGTTGSGLITLRATDASNTFVEDVFQLTVTPGGTQELVNVIRINSGGLAQNFGGEAWVADQFFTGGNTYSTAAGISGTTQDQVYQTERFGNFTYAIPVPSAGSYAVDLHFAEIYFTTAGSRIFNINVENGQFVRNNLDLIQTIGSINQAFVLRADNLNITDGVINITFTTVADNAKISGIAVGRYGTPPSNSPPVVSNPIPDQIATVSQMFSYTFPLNTFSDPNAGTTLTYSVSLSNGNPLPAWLSFDAPTRSFSGTAATGDVGVSQIRVTASDGENTVNDIFALTVSEPGTTTFYRALNLNGAQLTIDGNNWQSSTGAANFSFTQVGGGVFANQGVTLNPSTDANRATMIRSSIWGNTVNVNLTAIPNGTYDVYVYVWEDNFTQTFSVSLEGSVVVPVHNSGSAGTWNKLGPFRATITDGAINVSANGGHACLSGIEIWSVNGTQGNTPPIVSNPIPDQLATVSQEFSYTIPLNTFSDLDAGTTLAYSASLSNGNPLPSWLSFNPTTRMFTGTATSGDVGVLQIQMTASDGEATASDTFALTVNEPGSTTFYRALNLNGAQTTIDGNNWQSSTGAANFSFTQVGGGVFANQSVPLIPGTDTNRATMIRSSIWGNTVNVNVTAVPNGTYDVYLYVWEDNFTQTFSVSLEGSVVVPVHNSGSAGTWNKLGPFRTNITDGAINVSANGGHACLSGIEIWRAAAGSPFVLQPYPDQSVSVADGSLVVPLANIFNDDGGVNNLTFSVPNNTNPALISNTQIVGTQLTFTLSGNAGTGLITLRATDASNAFVEDVFQLTVTPEGPAQLVNLIRINAGGPAQNFGGEAWVADQYFAGGNTYSTAAAINGTTQDQIYQTERWGNVQYSIPVPGPGTYAVDLHLAEIYFNTTGSRVFNINIENGQFTRNNLDIVQAFGASNTAYVLRADNLAVNDGFINITFTSIVNNAKISGIAVGRYETGAQVRSALASKAPVVKTPPNVTIYEGQAWSYQVEATDPDGDKLSYSTRGLPASLYIDKTSGFIKGTIEANANTFPVTVKVTDATGLSTEANFVVTVAARPILRETVAQQLLVYPNPVDKNEFSVKLDVKQSGGWSFALLDFAGRQIKLGEFQLNEGVQELTFDLTPYKLSAGLYYLSVQNGKEKQVVKIGIKQNRQ